MNAVPLRSVKEAYVVAQFLAQECFVEPLVLEDYLQRFTAAKVRTAALSDAELDHWVVYEGTMKIHTTRLEMYNRSEFVLGTVILKDCSVWPRMGHKEGRLNRNWARGIVPDVADLFPKHAEVHDPLHAMKPFAAAGLYDDYPIIVYRRKSNPSCYRIDDGNHRAVARSLLGRTEALAFIGVSLRGESHGWKWPKG